MRWCPRGSGKFQFASMVVAGCLAINLPAANTQTESPAGGATTNQPFQLKVSSNLVVVRVVVRDAQGKPVEGLRQQDFHLFDRGKEQAISQFEVQSPAPPPIASPAATPTQTAPSRGMPANFLALYFDDLNTSDADMIQARDAADQYLAANLRPQQRVAIFTTEGVLSDFASDPRQIHEALFKLHASARGGNRVADCPSLTDYQAQQIERFSEDKYIDAWKVALDEAAHRCPMSDTMILMLARSVLGRAQIQARGSLQRLREIVQYLSRMPGQRTLILLSPGFLSESEQYHLDRLTDQALRAQVVISSLDPRGLALLMRETDVTRSYAPSANSGVISATHNVDSNSELAVTNVLAEVAQGTGGEFFHNNNDLKAGLGALSGSPVYYLLAFVPSDMKPDGKFHTLKVTLSAKEKGVTVQARRGYFAGKEEPLEAKVGGTSGSDAEAQAREQLREAVMGTNDAHELPVELRTEISKASDANQLSVLAHLDTKSLHFRKAGARNQNTVTFVSVVFDQRGEYVTGQQRQAQVDLPDDSLAHLFITGMDIKIDFQLKPGAYTLREVVTDSEDHRITALSRNVQIH